MKKIININLSGRVIPIEDAAYQTLQRYIESLRNYFANEESRDEIINDIESRVAELMSDKINKGASAITGEDLESIIDSMGRVEDFEAADIEGDSGAQADNRSYNETYTEPKRRGRLYRNLNDKFLGGVCSGIANHFDVDPTIVRILFVILLFASGLGFLAYIIMWIVLPGQSSDGPQLSKRLYRNPDDKIFGGVAGGLAAYFNKSARTIRLIFAAPILFSILINILQGFRWGYDAGFGLNFGFGSLTGTFILIYIILWVILPEANTKYEKMEMRGETVDINRIRQNVKEGMGNVKDRMKTWSGEVKESADNLSAKAKEFSATRGKEFTSEVNESFQRRRGGIGHAFGVLFKVFFLFIAGVIAFSLFMGLIALFFGGVAWWPITDYVFTSDWQHALAWGTLVFFFIVPLIAFITWIVRRVARIKSKKSYLGWVFGGLWTIGWIVMILFVVSITSDFRNYEHVDSDITVPVIPGDKLTVAVSAPQLEYTGGFGWMNEDINGWDLSKDSMYIASVQFNVIASPGDQYHAILKKYSYGKTEDDALNRAERISYQVMVKDSVLDLANSYAIDKESKYRGQQIEIELKVPIGKKIRFDESITQKLNSWHVRVKRRYRNDGPNISFDTDERPFRYRTGVDYIMGINGQLTRADQSDNLISPDGQYRYDDSDSLQIEKTIEQKRKELEDLENRKKDLENRTSRFLQTKKIKQEGLLAAGPSPVSAIAEWF